MLAQRLTKVRGQQGRSWAAPAGLAPPPGASASRRRSCSPSPRHHARPTLQASAARAATSRKAVVVRAEQQQTTRRSLFGLIATGEGIWGRPGEWGPGCAGAGARR